MRSAFSGTPLAIRPSIRRGRRVCPLRLHAAADAPSEAEREPLPNATKGSKVPPAAEIGTPNDAVKSNAVDPTESTNRSGKDNESEIRNEATQEAVAGNVPKKNAEEQRKVIVVSKEKMRTSTPEKRKAPRSYTDSSLNVQSSAEKSEEQKVVEGNKKEVVKKEMPRKSMSSTSTSTSVKMSPEQIEKAKAAKAERARKAEEEKIKQAEKRRELVAKAERVLVRIGGKTGAVELGRRARAKLEAAVEEAINVPEEKRPLAEKGGGKNASSSAASEKPNTLNVSAAKAFRSLSEALDAKWHSAAAPWLRQKIPEELRRFDDTVLAAAIVGLAAAVVVFPVIFGGGAPAKSPAAKKLDADTSTLEKKLARDRSASTKTVTSESEPQKIIFPKKSEELPTPPKPPLPSKRPAQPVAPVPSKPSTDLASKQEESASSKQPDRIVPKPLSTGQEKPLVTDSSRIDKRAIPDEKLPQQRPEKVTPDAARVAISRGLGPRAGLVVGASFDSLAAEPTVILDVTKDYRRLSEDEQRAVAVNALKGARSLGYENVTFIERDSGLRVASAGVQVMLDDEVENLRAQLRATQGRAENLAKENTEEISQLAALKARFEEERDEYSVVRKDLENQLSLLQFERSNLVADLRGAEREIAQMPDRKVLEERTEEAEAQAGKMSATVDMLSRQVTVARDAETQSKKAAEEARKEAQNALRVRDDALASVDGRVKSAKQEAEEAAAKTVASIREEVESKLNATEIDNSELRSALATLERTSSQRLTSAEDAFKQQLAQQQEASERTLVALKSEREREAQDLTAKYTKQMADAQQESKINFDALKKDSNKKVADLSNALSNLDKSTAAKLTATTASYEKQLAEEKEKAAKERDALKSEKEAAVQTIQSKYDKLLDDLSQKAKADLDAYRRDTDKKLAATQREATATVDRLQKALDGSKREMESVRARADQTAVKAAKERESFVRRVQELEAKLKQKVVSAAEVSAS